MRKHGKRRAMRACLARVIRRNGPKIRIKRLQCRKLMDNDCFRSKSVCGSCWVWAATVADLSEGRMPFSCGGIKRKVADLALSIRQGAAGCRTSQLCSPPSTRQDAASPRRGQRGLEGRVRDGGRACGIGVGGADRNKRIRWISSPILLG